MVRRKVSYFRRRGLQVVGEGEAPLSADRLAPARRYLWRVGQSRRDRRTRWIGRATASSSRRAHRAGSVRARSPLPGSMAFRA